MRRITRWLVVLACAISVLAGAQTALGCTCKPRTDSDCIGTAKTGIGSRYWWGHACWNQKSRDWGGADCSGFVVKAWQVPRPSAISEDYHPYGTSHLFTYNYHWFPITRKSLWKSDCLGYKDPDGSGPKTGHVVMYYYGDKYGTAMVLEAPGAGKRIRQGWRDVSSTKWRAIRRHNLIITAGPA